MNTPEQIIIILEDTAQSIQKAKINLKKSPKERLTKGYLESRLKSIDEYWVTYRDAHKKLLLCTTKEQKVNLPHFVNEEFYMQEDSYLTIQGLLKDMIESKSSSGSKDGSSQSSSTHDSSRHVLARLPKIQLPTFDGRYEEWTTFKDLFVSLVHSDNSLTNVQKLHYLKTSITGEAATLLKFIQITNDNYSLAWDILKNRYGNKRLIINSLLKRLFSLRKNSNNIQSAQSLKIVLDTTSEIINSLRNQNIDTDSWDPMLIFLTVQKLDLESHKQWEDYAHNDNVDELPTWEDLKKFLETKVRSLELVSPSTSKEKNTKVFHVANQVKTCVRCKGDHTLSHCEDFIKLSPVDRGLYVKDNGICFNCLSLGHSSTRCKVPHFCKICHKAHHTLLHRKRATVTSDKQETNHLTVSNESREEMVQVNTRIDPTSDEPSSIALLATALVKIKDDYGHTTIVKALVDTGSQASFITERAAQSLRLKRTGTNGTITGIGSSKTTVKQATEIYVLPRQEEEFKIKTYIIPTRLTTQLPTTVISYNTWPHLEGLVLADPSFNQPGRVDMLLGVDVCANIMKGEIIKGPPGTPSAQNTSLGWILFGTIHKKQGDDIISMHLNLQLDNMLKNMWEQEPNEIRRPTQEERKCEEIYKATTTRTDEGRYIVTLPKKTEPLQCTEGRTREIAQIRLNQLEKRFEKNTNLKNEYVKVMEEYIYMNHMEEVPKEEINNPAVYLPHHAIIKAEKETSKVRTVFNASQKGYNQISLNEELLVGPQLQDDMRSLIIRWRTKKVCFVADIQKMYRQILVTKQDSDLQRILWRANKEDPVKDYRLKRVTFGTASAPYLAVRTLHQVAEDEGYHNLEAATIIKQDFYMDDLMSGKDNLEEAIKTAKEIDSILKRGGFVLQKWCSNSAEFLKQFEPEQRSAKVKLDITIDGSIRALGLQWNMGTDKFQYNLNLPAVTDAITKRTILADIQRLFDPLGWLAPSILPAKLLIQKLWLQGITWDEEVNETIAEEWLELRNSFQHLHDIEIDRWLQTTENLMKDVTVHGFCDASNKAYGAVAYMRVKTSDGEVKTTIIAAKTRVASIKSKSLPRLELNGAVLLAGLLKQIKEALRIPTSQIYAWTDSTIVLSWLFGDPSRWNTYVRNRVVEILEDITNHNWYHVQSQDNPADIASRGMPLADLQEYKMWWKGPEWLSHNKIDYCRPKNITTSLERKEFIETNLKIENRDTTNFTTKFECCENLPELLKVITYSKRFLKGKKLPDKNTAVRTR